MTLWVAEIVEIYPGSSTRMARVSIAGAITRASLMLLPEACVGDTVLVAGGVAISVEERMKMRVN